MDLQQQFLLVVSLQVTLEQMQALLIQEQVVLLFLTLQFPEVLMVQMELMELMVQMAVMVQMEQQVLKAQQVMLQQ